MSQRIIKTHSKSSNRVERVGEVRKPTRFFSKKQESTVAEELGGKRQPNSGATQFAKGDVLLDKFVVECKTKTTHCDSISIKKEWIDKVSKEALNEGKPYSAVAFNFGPSEDNYFIIDKYLFEQLLESLQGTKQ